MDEWVLRVSIAIPLICLGGLAVWHLVSFVAKKLPKRPRIYRQSPEPPSGMPSLPDDPQRLEKACTALEEVLADRYVELGESWLRRGERQKAALAFGKVIRMSPQGRRAALAQERLREIGTAVEKTEDRSN
jgi:hypothetical protein